MGHYIPTTDSDRQTMLRTVGVDSVDALYAQIPPQVRASKLQIPKGKSEMEVQRQISRMADQNQIFRSIFRGAGAYNHYIPAIVKGVTSKEEFVTAYTPYQAEISQGVLQSIFEYQTMICGLTGMDVSNASVYDGSSATAEAAAMCRDRKRSKVVIAETVNPHVLETVRTYCNAAGAEVLIAPAQNGLTDLEKLRALLADDSACFILQHPNYLGLWEQAKALGEIAHESGAKFIMNVNPISLGLCRTPADYGADIAVGEGQPLGMPLSFGGPYLGFMACKQALLRKLPGRIVGETTDKNGERAFVLTLQAREQHIRREKASSNICSNQALCAMTATVYLAAMGDEGLREAASQCYSKAHYLSERLCEIPGFALAFQTDFFHEFMTTCPILSGELLTALEQRSILGGLPVEDGILWCATECNTKEEMDELVDAVKEVCGA